MTVIVDDLRPDDRRRTEGFARVRDRALPYMLYTADSLAYDVSHAHPEAHYRPLVAELDGEVVGTAQVGIAYDSPEPGQGYLNVYVDPDRTRRGAGSLLVRAAERHLAALGATRLFTWVLDEPGNRAFAERHGYRAGRSAHFLRLDLAGAALPPRQDPPPGVELRTASDFADDPRPLFALDAETSADEPGDIPHEFTDYQAWLRETWHHPPVQRGTDHGRARRRPPGGLQRGPHGRRNPLRHRDDGHRRRLPRSRSRQARQERLPAPRPRSRCTEAFTGNDSGNGPMIAINKWFGYEICGTEVRHVRELG